MSDGHASLFLWALTAAQALGKAEEGMAVGDHVKRPLCHPGLRQRWKRRSPFGPVIWREAGLV